MKTMAIYHLEAKVVSRGTGRSAVAASAYLSCTKILNDYDGVQHDFTRKKGLAWQQVFLPPMAPAEWQDRSVLWNTVEENEKTKDSRLAREFVAALPIELNREQQQKLLTEFIQEQFVADGMCADVAIHDTDGHNPHAHIMLTVRPLDENGKWQYKTEKEYLYVRNGEEQGFTAAEFKTAQTEGWEKQYQYKADKNKVYMAPSEAEKQGYERASKYPKSTKYGRQNPITERWNSDEQLVLWRKAWADVSNHYLERAGSNQRIDHRSHAERGLDEQPTIHEGVGARALEKKGIVSDRCELNRQIKADNALLRELKAQIKNLMAAVKNTVPELAAALENIRKNMIIFCYQLGHIRTNSGKIMNYLGNIKPALERYSKLSGQLRCKAKEKKELVEEKKETAVWNISKHRDLAARITELTEDIEELRTEKNMILQSLQCEDDSGISAVKKDVASMEGSLKNMEQQKEKYSTELDNALSQYADIWGQAADSDPVELGLVQKAIRPAMEQEAILRLQDAYGKNFSPLTMSKSITEAEQRISKETAHFRNEKASDFLMQNRNNRYHDER